MSRCLEVVKAWRSLLVVVLTPLLLLPLPLVINTPEGKTAYVLFLMAIYWVSEAIPIAVTSLLPMVLFPMMGVMEAKVIAKSYISDLLMLFLGGLLVAVAIERWNLHRRIALRILLLVGSEPRWLMLGLMTATWFLSMWISNTATTAMMVPITEAILQQLKTAITDEPTPEEGENGKVPGEKPINGDVDNNFNTPTSQHTQPAARPESKHFKRLCKGMSLCICYAANSGGISTLTGTGPNLILKENVDKLYVSRGLESPINFATWMGFGFPLSLLVLLICWVWLQIVFLRCRGLCDCCSKSSEEKKSQGRRVKAIIRAEYDKLGPVSFAERAVMFWFAMLVLLWISRDLGGAGGWGDAFRKKFVTDSTPAVLIGICLFFFPSENPFKRRGRSVTIYTEGATSMEVVNDDGDRVKPLLEWPVVHTKMPWSLFLLLGGGFALSEGCKVSGLSAWMGNELEVFSSIDKWGMLFILCFLTAAMTEVTSNTAISILLLPILSNLALRTGVHPLYYMLPSALACSFAFMLPVATPPNAIVFSYGHVKVIDMMVAGVVMNLLAVPALVLAIGTWGDAMFDFQNIPAAFFNASTSVTSSA